MTPDQFIPLVAPGAQSSHAVLGILASVTIAQAAVESGWGAHAPGNNLFGIKAIGGWDGPTTGSIATQEDNGGAHVEQAEFRAYPDWSASIADHSQFLLENERYTAAIQCTDAQSMCDALQAAGYSTNPGYSALLMGIINFHKLTQYDA